MGVDIGIAVYDEARELEYKMLTHLLTETEYLDEKVLAFSPVNLGELRHRRNALYKARVAAKPITPLAMDYNGERLSNLNIYVYESMEFKIREGVTLFPGTHEMNHHINIYNNLLKVPKKDSEDYEFIKCRRDLFVEMNENNLMLFAC